MKVLSTCLAVLVLLVLASASYGCGCTNLSPEKAFDTAEFVFIGKMIGGTEKNVADKKDESKRTLEAGDVTFDIDSGLDTFKGIRDRRSVIVKVSSGKVTNCEPYGLVPGEKYMVYANSGGTDFGDPLHAGPCVRIALLSGVNEDIEFIRRLREIGYGTIKGYVSLDTHRLENNGAEAFSRPDNISLKIIGPDQNSRTIPIDRSGNFDLNGLRAGTYRLIPQLPADYESAKESEEFTISGFVIHYTSVLVQFKSRLFGTIQDARGLGFDQNSVNLENSTTRVPGGSLGQDGKFEIKGVPPGDYMMYMEFRNEDDIYAFRRYYYPGTYDVTRAAKIRVGLSDLKRGFKFTLPLEFQVRKVRGKVFLPDGKPAEAASVLLLFQTSSKKNHFIPRNFRSRPIITDKNGQFSLNGLDGLTYFLLASGQKKDGTPVCSTPMKVVLTKDLSGAKLLLSRQGSSDGCQALRVYLEP